MATVKTTNNSKFENEEKKEITIPIDALNKKDSFVPVSINGYIWKIKRGEAVKVPVEVARILKEAGYIA
jgi:hypothetical protein